MAAEADGQNSEENISYVQEVMDRIYKGLNVGIFTAVDRQGKIIYQAHDPEERGEIAEHWGIEEVLDGRDMVVAEGSPSGWSILSMVPARRDDNFYGAIIIGTKIDDKFAEKIAFATDVDVSFGTVGGVFASSLPGDEREKYYQNCQTH